MGEALGRLSVRKEMVIPILANYASGEQCFGIFPHGDTLT